mgnify:CR=1 FL=1
MILAGDIGGSKTYLALYDWKEDRVEPTREEKFYNSDFESFEEILSEFFEPHEDQSNLDETEDEPDADLPTKADAGGDEPIEAACFGVAGSIVDNRCRAKNIPWELDGQKLAQHFDIPKVQLFNDVEA